MSSLHLVSEISEEAELPSSGRPLVWMPQLVDHAADQGLICLSRFMSAVSSTLDLEGVCSAAAREFYDLSPYRQIAFRLDFPTGSQTIRFCPGIRQITWKDAGHDKLKLVTEVTELSEWHEGRQVLSLPDGLGIVEIVPVSSNDSSTAIAEPLRGSLLACLGTALLNAVEHSRVKELAMVDSLTGLLNRRVFDEMISLDSRKELLPLSLLLIDLDDFKLVNDRFGHQAGDEVLSCVGRFLKEGCRGTDIVARYGGEEFAVLLPMTQITKAEEIANRLLHRLASKVFVFAERPHRVTASIGLATLAKTRLIAVDQLIQRADQALYQAKREGKNRVVTAERPPAKSNLAKASGQVSLPGM